MDMTQISPSNIKRFLAAASLALAIPLAVAATQGGPRGAGDCAAMEGAGHYGKHGGDMGHAGRMGLHYLRGLNLTEAQRDKVFEIEHAQAPQMRDMAKAHQKAEDELRKLTASPDYSEAKARALGDAVGKSVGEMAMARAKTDRQIFDVLTPEQRQQAAEMKQAGRGNGPRGMNAEARTPPTR
jgi:periplasmic protein CpxP/Spy